MPPWSYSGLTAFESCPRKYFHLKVERSVVEPSSEHATHGVAVHQALEYAVAGTAPLPEKYLEWLPLVQKLIDAPGEKLVELEIALDKDFKPVEWQSPSAWCRGIVDVVVDSGAAAVACDYKTGRRKPESTQLMLFAALLLHSRPKLERVMTAFLWLKDNRADRATYNRADLPSIWREFLPRVARMERAYKTNEWPPRPSGLCNGWCPVGRDKCEFWNPKR